MASIIHLAHSLGLRVVAEGVENTRTSTELRSLGCDLAQGYHFARPLPSGLVPTWVATHAITSVHDDARTLAAPELQ